MKAKVVNHTVSELISLKENNMLTVNSEYQRGEVWKNREKQLLVDSIFRGYPLPMIYLHKKKQSVGKYTRDDFDIIDGQQRLNALYEFYEGAFFLLNPLSTGREGRFPAFVRDQVCPWAGKHYDDLSAELKDNFQNTTISVAMIETDEGNQARDLFIRLQGGQPLNHQETRDAWPGAFTDFILKLGGKPDVPRYPGHHFFQRLLGMKPKSDRGKTRMLAAQLTMLFIERRRSGSWKLPGINNQDLNDYYYDNLDFDEKSENSLQLIETLNLLENILVGKNLPKLRAHDAMHALMLVDELRQGYASGWQADFASALENFMMRLVRAKKSNETGEFDEYWMEYGQWTRTNSDKGDNILRRHRFYTSKMVRGMGKLKPIDNARFFGDLQRKILFFDQGKICTVCMKEINFDDMEIHHITPHSKGGQTTIQNGAIVHSYCHPKSDKDVALFDEAWKSRKVFIDNKRKGIIEFSDGKIAKNEGADFEQDGVVVPHGTPARMEYKNGDQLYQGHFEDGVLMVDGLAYNSLSSAASALAITNDGKKTRLNGWLYWSVLLPGTSEWVSLKKLRDQMESED